MIFIRPIKYSDRHWILRLMNQKSVRIVSFSQNKITKTGNDCYWRKKLVDKNFKAFAGFWEKKPVCVIRIDKGLISVAVDQKFRQRGIAFAILNSFDLGGCVAEVKPENTASIKLFEKLGFNIEKIVFTKKDTYKEIK